MNKQTKEKIIKLIISIIAFVVSYFIMDNPRIFWAMVLYIFSNNLFLKKEYK